jgi:uncharacterized protein YegP (UPF0339 family)
MSNDTRFEIVRTEAGYHVRLRAPNARITWTTEVYESQSGAERAIEWLAETFWRGHSAIQCVPVDERS